MLKSSTTSENETIASIAIGGFDGLHLGHRKLLDALGKNGALLVVEKGFSPALTPAQERCRYTEHPCFFLDFDAIKGMEASDFMRYLRVLFPNLKKIVVGYDFRFGKNRRGDHETLKQMEGVAVEVIAEQRVAGISVHANEIRNLLRDGKIELANRLLGRRYSVRGDIISGQGLGKKALYPTCNLDTGDFLLPKEGVYITQSLIDGKLYPSVTFIGKRLSADNRFSVETHILEEDLEVKEDKAELFFLAYLRSNKKFDSLHELKRQIGEDIEKAKRAFTG
ncbi:MAG: bifunctional riboflavin kinase/FAD synthetase [Sulfurospirillum sp.]|nr:MAG: bifunctional riboflavin kinase/FAD synthetase [Sulfurospirillum sp.]